MQIHETWEMLTVCGCQLLLIAFNFVLLSLSVMNWMKRAKGGRPAAATVPDKGDVTATLTTSMDSKGVATRRQVIRASPPPY